MGMQFDHFDPVPSGQRGALLRSRMLDRGSRHARSLIDRTSSPACQRLGRYECLASVSGRLLGRRQLLEVDVHALLGCLRRRLRLPSARALHIGLRQSSPHGL